MNPVPKPPPREKGKRRKTWVKRRSESKRRAESVVLAKTYEHADRRDGYCRLSRAVMSLGPCGGASELAHLGPWKRYATRGMAPEDRHPAHGVAKICDRHHDGYDANKFKIESVDGDTWADGRLRVVDPDGIVLHEEMIAPPRRAVL